MSDTATTSEFGTFDAEGNYIPRAITENNVNEVDLDAAYSQSMVTVEDGQLVEGTVVKIDRDEVLLDIGYKAEGVIPSRELSIRNDADPFEIVSMGEVLEALVLQKEDKEGRLVLSKKRAQYERAWGKIEEVKEVMRDLRAHHCDMLTLGQYLQPSLDHLAVERFVTPDEFKELEVIGYEMGFSHVASGPMVRSSYFADEQAAGVI